MVVTAWRRESNVFTRADGYVIGASPLWPTWRGASAFAFVPSWASPPVPFSASAPPVPTFRLPFPITSPFSAPTSIPAWTSVVTLAISSRARTWIPARASARAATQALTAASLLSAHRRIISANWRVHHRSLSLLLAVCFASFSAMYLKNYSKNFSHQSCCTLRYGLSSKEAQQLDMVNAPLGPSDFLWSRCKPGHEEDKQASYDLMNSKSTRRIIFQTMPIYSSNNFSLFQMKKRNYHRKREEATKRPRLVRVGRMVQKQGVLAVVVVFGLLLAGYSLCYHKIVF